MTRIDCGGYLGYQAGKRLIGYFIFTIAVSAHELKTEDNVIFEKIRHISNPTELLWSTMSLVFTIQNRAHLTICTFAAFCQMIKKYKNDILCCWAQNKKKSWGTIASTTHFLLFNLTIARPQKRSNLFCREEHISLLLKQYKSFSLIVKVCNSQIIFLRFWKF